MDNLNMQMSVRQFANDAYIICHNENINLLHRSLLGEGFICNLVKGPYNDNKLRYSSAVKCLVNHSNAWKSIVSSGRNGLVVEADFVPVEGFSLLPIPAPSGLEDSSLCYLYACGPQYWDVAIPNISARGHAGATVAYVISPRVADLMLEYCNCLIERNPNGNYCTWDCEIGYWLKDRGFQSYIPFKNYGEHGGFWNPEHNHSHVSWPHRADVLAGPLAFAPFYATSKFNFYLIRVKSFFYGVARLLLGRLVSWHNIKRKGGQSLLTMAVYRFNPVSQIFDIFKFIATCRCRLIRK